MSLKSRADSLERAKKFTADIVENGKVFYMLHPEGGAFLCDSNEFFDKHQRPAAIIPIWSSQYLPYAKKFADDLEMQEINYEEFCFNMLPAMVEDQMILGLNWDHQGFGVEMTAVQLCEDIFAGVDGDDRPYLDLSHAEDVCHSLYQDVSADLVEEEALPKGKYDSLLSRNNKLAPSRDKFATPFLTLYKLPNPWKLFLQTDSQKTDKAHFCLGKKGVGAECKLIYEECPTPVGENIDFNKLWSSLEPVLSLDNPLVIENLTIQAKNETLPGIIISTPRWMPVYGWFTANNLPNWHFVFKSTLPRKKGDIEEIKKLLREVFVITEQM